MRRITLSLTILVLMTFVLQAQAASVPQLINYQGRLTDANGVGLTGTKRLEFNVYDAATGGNIVWGIQIIDDVPLVDGQFNVILSTDNQGRSIADAFYSRNRYIAIKVGEPHTDLSGVPEISPRQQILSTPYAVHALHGVPTGTIVAFWGYTAPPGWLLCHGQTVPTGSEYESLRKMVGSNLPDLRGLFLRGRNEGRTDDWKDPDERPIGRLQGDATRRPNNPFTSDAQGNHRHGLLDWRYHNRRDDPGNFGHLESRPDGDRQYTEYAGAHTHTITGGGDSETRPKNICINWIIKY